MSLALFNIKYLNIQDSTPTVSRLPGATDFGWGDKYRITENGHLGKCFNLHHFVFERLGQCAMHVVGKSSK